VDKHLDRKPTTFVAARDKSGRRDRDYLYPSLYPNLLLYPSQTNLFLS